MASTNRKPVTLKLGAHQANVVISALTDHCIALADEVEYGEPSAIRAQQIAMNMREGISRQLRKAGLPSNW